MNRRKFLGSAFALAASGIWSPAIPPFQRARFIPVAKKTIPASGGGAWTPASIPNMVFGLEPRKAAYTTGTTQATDGQTIATLPDYWSGNGNNFTQSNASYKPTYVANVDGTRDGMRFTSANSQGMVGPSDLIGVGAFTLAFRMLYVSNPASPPRVVDNGSCLVFGTQPYVSRDGASTFASGAEWSESWRNWAITSTSANPSLVNIYRDGALYGSADQSAGPPTAGGYELDFGNRSTDYARPIDANFVYLFLYSRVLTTDEITLLHNYLA